MNPTLIEWIAAALFAVAILHSFATGAFERLARLRPAHAGLWHLLGEIEVVFGFWAMVLVVAMFALQGSPAATRYIDSRDFTEPLFVFAIMVIAGTRPILAAATALIRALVRVIPLPGSMGFYFVVLAVVPLLGSLVTEPAAMTLAALILSRRIFSAEVSPRLKYATLGVLFVNISIGGTLTPFAAPPVLMVASKWDWDIGFMLANFGGKAAIAVLVNALAATLVFSGTLCRLTVPEEKEGAQPAVPAFLVAVHLALLAAVVIFAHHPAIFLGIFLFFLGIAHAYSRHQDPLILREGLLVAFFLAGLVVLGGLQSWWLQPLLLRMSEDAVFFGAAALTAFTDNAALTYLGAQVEGLADGFKYALVAGAVTGGGLTIIANAPNPAGLAILRAHFEDQAVSPFKLLLAALPPTVVAAFAFRFL
ncbi:putative Na+/H+ antiporter [Niveibacterium terrae]|uniref:putative Na+/H+ antiporter n=1 Tax=Niveibacterium terrae TaxID=3373598 RepID=UPI003A900123